LMVEMSVITSLRLFVVRLALFHKKLYSLLELSVKISVMVRKMPVMKN